MARPRSLVFARLAGGALFHASLLAFITACGGGLSHTVGESELGNLDPASAESLDASADKVDKAQAAHDEDLAAAEKAEENVDRAESQLDAAERGLAVAEAKLAYEEAQKEYLAAKQEESAQVLLVAQAQYELDKFNAKSKSDASPETKAERAEFEEQLAEEQVTLAELRSETAGLQQEKLAAKASWDDAKNM